MYGAFVWHVDEKERKKIICFEMNSKNAIDNIRTLFICIISQRICCRVYVLIWPMQSQSDTNWQNHIIYDLMFYTYKPVFNSLENMPCYEKERKKEEDKIWRAENERVLSKFVRRSLAQRQLQHNENYLQIIILCSSLYSDTVRTFISSFAFFFPSSCSRCAHTHTHPL